MCFSSVTFPPFIHFLIYNWHLFSFTHVSLYILLYALMSTCWCIFCQWKMALHTLTPRSKLAKASWQSLTHLNLSIDDDDVMPWKRFLHYLPFVKENDRSPVVTLTKGLGALVFLHVVSLNKLVNKQSICLWTGEPWLSCDITVMNYGFSFTQWYIVCKQE